MQSMLTRIILVCGIGMGFSGIISAADTVTGSVSKEYQPGPPKKFFVSCSASINAPAHKSKSFTLKYKIVVTNAAGTVDGDEYAKGEKTGTTDANGLATLTTVPVDVTGKWTNANQADLDQIVQKWQGQNFKVTFKVVFLDGTEVEGSGVAIQPD